MGRSKWKFISAGAGSALLVGMVGVFAAPTAHAAVMCEGNVATIVGTPGADSLMGTNGPDVIVGLTGNDVVDGKGGDDLICQSGAIAGLGLTTVTIVGGPGNDTLSMRDLDNSSLTDVNLTTGKVKIGQAGGPGNNIRGTVATIENLVGPSTADYVVLTGNSGSNRLEVVGSGSISPMGGNDIVIGTLRNPWEGATVEYTRATSAITVDLNTGLVSGWSNDTLIGIQSVIGTYYADVIKGNNQNNGLFGGRGADTIDGRSGNDSISSDNAKATLKGGAGDDLILPGPGGAKLIDGGLGVDSIDLNYTLAAATVDLGTQSMVIGGVTSTYAGVEGVTGTQFDDTLVGSEGDNVIVGGAGNDVLRGLGGRDKLWGSSEVDSMDGGDGVDRCGGDFTLATFVGCEETRNIVGGD